MNYKCHQIRKTDQYSMLCGSEMEKPKFKQPSSLGNHTDWGIAKCFLNAQLRHWLVSFHPICPMKDDEALRKFAYDFPSGLNSFEKAITEGIDIDSGRIGFEKKCICCGEYSPSDYDACWACNNENVVQYAILLPTELNDKKNHVDFIGEINKQNAEHNKQSKIWSEFIADLNEWEKSRGLIAFHNMIQSKYFIKYRNDDNDDK